MLRRGHPVVVHSQGVEPEKPIGGRCQRTFRQRHAVFEQVCSVYRVEVGRSDLAHGQQLELSYCNEQSKFDSRLRVAASTGGRDLNPVRL